jgi:ABC-type transport system involved in Fe-S cluster assembly fused permease/ATPase subunit
MEKKFPAGKVTIAIILFIAIYMGISSYRIEQERKAADAQSDARSKAAMDQLDRTISNYTNSLGH